MCQGAEIPKYKTEVILTTSIDFKKVHIKKKKKERKLKISFKKSATILVFSVSASPAHRELVKNVKFV